MKNPVFPAATIQGHAMLADGKDVTIMSKKDWNLYCYNFNALNGLEQPQNLIETMQSFHEEENVK